MKKWLGNTPVACDLCNKKFRNVFIDGKTIQGPWGLLCSNCHRMYGYGLGIGRGQKYDLETRELLEG